MNSREKSGNSLTSKLLLLSLHYTQRQTAITRVRHRPKAGDCFAVLGFFLPLNVLKCPEFLPLDLPFLSPPKTPHCYTFEFRKFLNDFTFDLQHPLPLLPTGSPLFPIRFGGSAHTQFLHRFAPFLCLYLGIPLTSNRSYSPTFHRSLTVLQFLHFSPIPSSLLITSIQNFPQLLISSFQSPLSRTIDLHHLTRS